MTVVQGAELRGRARDRVAELVDSFDRYLVAFEGDTPFTKAGQWENHARTIELRRSHGTIESALHDEAFLSSLWDTLRAWGIGVRRSRLVEFPDFVAELRRWSDDLETMSGLKLEASDRHAGQQLWSLIEGMHIVENKAQVVAMTKTLHHLLPDLLPPIDRAYTGTFFGFNVLAFQDRQHEVFTTCWAGFLKVARNVDLGSYVGTAPWNTSITKVIDNAVVGYCLVEELDGRSRRAQPARKTRPRSPQRDTWTIDELFEDLEAFATELTVAGLKENSIVTYVGRSETFVRWLAGTYAPRGRNSDT